MLRIVIHQTRTVWLSRYFAVRYDANLSAWLVASINFRIISHTGGLCSPAQVHVSIDTLLCVHLIGKLHIFEWNSDIVDLISYINNFTKSVNMELACSFTTIIRICLCRGSSWLGVNDSPQFALPTTSAQSMLLWLRDITCFICGYKPWLLQISLKYRQRFDLMCWCLSSLSRLASHAVVRHFSPPSLPMFAFVLYVCVASYKYLQVLPFIRTNNFVIFVNKTLNYGIWARTAPKNTITCLLVVSYLKLWRWIV